MEGATIFEKMDETEFEKLIDKHKYTIMAEIEEKLNRKNEIKPQKRNKGENRRSMWLLVRVTEKEKSEIYTLAQEAGYSASDYVRMTALKSNSK